MTGRTDAEGLTRSGAKRAGGGKVVERTRRAVEPAGDGE
jgi:hypothetical protein